METDMAAPSIKYTVYTIQKQGIGGDWEDLKDFSFLLEYEAKDMMERIKQLEPDLRVEPKELETQLIYE